MSYNGKVADITYADVNKHNLTLTQLGLPNNTVAAILGSQRMSGSGLLVVYPANGAFGHYISAAGQAYTKLVNLDNGILTHKVSVANDDYDLYCFGYFITVEEASVSGGGGNALLPIMIAVIAVIIAGGLVRGKK